MGAAEQRQPWPTVGIVRNPDRDYRDLKGESITLPVSWFERVDAAAKRASNPQDGECEPKDVFIQLVRWSLEDADGVAPLPEGKDLAGPKRTTSISLSLRLWGLLKAEMERRGMSLNKAFQTHLLRGLVADEAQAATSRKPRRQ